MAMTETVPSIAIRKHDLLKPEGQERSEQSTALMLARKLFETDQYLQGEFIAMGTGIGVSPEFHELAEMATLGVLSLRDLATICFWLGGFQSRSGHSDELESDEPIDEVKGKIYCKFCGSVHFSNQRPAFESGGFYRGSWQCKNERCPSKQR